jgi:alkylation response protein AidB-like acyl-CoA dehydrogenase
VINGSKMWLTNGAEAKTAILLCRTDKGGGSRSLSQIIVPTGTPGITFGKPEKKMGLNGSHTYAVSLENVTVPLENVLGREGYGLHQTLEALDGGRIAIGALSVGLAQAAYEAALAYAKERTTFGKPIAEHQAIQAKIADMATTIEAARWLVYRAAWLRDQGQPLRCWRPRPSSSPPRSPRRSATTPSRSTAATATAASTPSSASTATTG